MAELEITQIKDKEIVYGCAFNIDFDRYSWRDGKVVHNICKPVIGMVRKSEYDNYGFFYLLKKDGTIRKSGRVSSHARHFANTYEECVQIFNQLIQDKIDKLKLIAENLKEELI